MLSQAVVRLREILVKEPTKKEHYTIQNWNAVCTAILVICHERAKAELSMKKTKRKIKYEISTN